MSLTAGEAFEKAPPSNPLLSQGGVGSGRVVAKSCIAEAA